MIFSLYIHIPLCKKKCSYCDFFSVPVENYSYDKIKNLLDTILKELELKLELLLDAKFDTIFIGGGTPSIIPEDLLYIFLESVQNLLGDRLASDPEITIEANIESCSNQFIEACIDANVNRLSLGVQSFNKKNLQYIGRSTYPENIFNTVLAIKNKWTKNLSIDIISGINEDYAEDLKRAVLIDPDHLSVYQLSMEDGSILHRKVQKNQFIIPAEDLQRRAILETEDYLTEKGYRRYEVSNYSKTGRQSLHNLKYWNMQSYIGVGPAAVSSIYEKGNLQRLFNPKDISKYVETISSGKYYFEKEILTNFDFLIEHYIMGCRLTTGISKKYFLERFGNNPASFIPQTIQKWMDKRYIKTEKMEQAALNKNGLLFLDSFLFDVYEELLSRRDNF